MTDTGSGAHDLDVAGYGTTDVAGAIFVRDGALADIGNDFHIRVGVTAEAAPGSDLVVVPDHKGTERTICGIAVP